MSGDFGHNGTSSRRKQFEKQVGNRQGQRTDKTLREKIPEVAPGKRTRELAAEKAGFGTDKTYRQAAKVVLNGTPGEFHDYYRLLYLDLQNPIQSEVLLRIVDVAVRY